MPAGDERGRSDVGDAAALKRALVFDSGVGGLSVADAMVNAQLPLTLDYLADVAWLPYGARADSELQARVPALIAAAVEARAPDLVVLACNTASTIALEAVRARVSVPVIGVVPPIKPAAERTRTGVIGLLATPATIRRPYTDDLVARFAADVTVLRFGSTALVAAAEAKLAGEPVPEAAIAEAIDGLFGQPGGDRIDVVALACTHFPLLAAELARAAPRQASWIESGPAIARRAMTVLGLDPSIGGPRPDKAFVTAPAAAAPFRARAFDGPHPWPFGLAADMPSSGPASANRFGERREG